MDTRRAGLIQLSQTLDRRFWFVAGASTVASLLVLGVPTAVIPNPLFIRMTPTDLANVLTWLASAPLFGLILASYVVKPAQVRDVHDGGTEWRASVGGIGSFFAIGCPICNKIVVGVLGVSGALNVFGPLQPLIGVASVSLLVATAVWQLRRRAHGCSRCAPMASITTP